VISVVIIDDSFMIRTLFQRELSRDPGLYVAGTAADSLKARELVLRLTPDVVVLDLGLAAGDGPALLRWLTLHGNSRIVVLAADDREAQRHRAAAREVGAEVLQKGRSALDAAALAEEVRLAVKRAALAARRAAADVPRTAISARPLMGSTETVIAIGASTGGTEALDRLITRLPATTPPILVVQHMPIGFTAALADRLDRRAAMTVREAVDGDPVTRGCCYISPGNRHMGISRQNGRYHIRLNDGPTVNRHKPSVDVLFLSMAKIVGAAAIGVILTGMGADGARGLKVMHDAGADTIAQDAASSVVFGMPKEAIALGAAGQILDLEAIPAAILALSLHHCAFPA
jgi:two-component system chemotaxis response regulator CheB